MENKQFSDQELDELWKKRYLFPVIMKEKASARINRETGSVVMNMAIGKVNMVGFNKNRAQPRYQSA